MHDELTTLPGIGPAIAADLRHLGIHSIKDLAESNPEQLFQRLQKITGHEQEPCLLYTFRCATYAARTPEPQADLLKWWNWKDRRVDDLVTVP